MAPDTREPEKRPARMELSEGDGKDLDPASQELLAFVAHELKSPLHAISSWLEVLKRALPGSIQFRSAIDGIERAAMSQAQLVARLGKLSGMVSGDLHLDVQPLDAAKLVRQAVDSLRVEAELGRRHVEFEPCTGTLPILGDSGWLSQALGNLFDNAIKFTPAHGRIAVSTLRHDSEVEIRVSDSGRGIAPAQTERIFDRFYHNGDGNDGAHENQRRLEMGLGLYVVRLIVEAHNGAVSAASEGLGRGATLIVRLPLASRGDGECGGLGSNTRRGGLTRQ